MNTALALFVFFAIMGLSSLITAILAYVQISAFAQDFNDIVETWEASPIVELELVDVGVGCSAGFMPIEADEWPGTYDACECDQSSFYYSSSYCSNITTTSTSSCSYDQLDCGCLDYPGYDAVPLEFGNQQICYRRDGDDALTREADGYSCSGSDQTCSGGNYDFCWPSSQLCPITDIAIGASNQTVDQDEEITGYFDGELPCAADFNGCTIYIKRGGVLAIQSDVSLSGFTSLPGSGLPLVNMAFTSRVTCTLTGCGYDGRSFSTQETNERDSFNGRGWVLKSTCGGCLHPDTEYLADGVSVSPDGDDIRYHLLDSDSEYNIFYYSGVPANFITNDLDYKLFLSFQTEVTWLDVDSCPTRAKVEDNQAQVNTLVTWQLLLLICTIISFFTITLYVGYKNVQAEWSDEDKAPFTKCKWVLKLLGYLFMVLSLVLALGLIDVFFSVIDSDEPCTDQLSGETFESLGNIIDGLAYKDYINGAAQSLDVVVDGVVSALGV